MADDNNHSGMSTNSVELKLKDNKTHIYQVHFYERCSFYFLQGGSMVTNVHVRDVSVGALIEGVVGEGVAPFFEKLLE